MVRAIRRGDSPDRLAEVVETGSGERAGRGAERSDLARLPEQRGRVPLAIGGDNEYLAEIVDGGGAARPPSARSQVRHLAVQDHEGVGLSARSGQVAGDVAAVVQTGAVTGG